PGQLRADHHPPASRHRRLPARAAAARHRGEDHLDPRRAVRRPADLRRRRRRRESEGVRGLRRAARRAGRARERGDRGRAHALAHFAAAHLAFVTVGRDYESAKAVWAEALTKRYAQNFEPLARKYGIIGTPEQCAEAIERFRAAGCNYVILNPIGPATQERE